MAEELRAVDVLSRENLKSQVCLTRRQLEKAYGNTQCHRIVYFLDEHEPHDKVAKQQAVLRLAQKTGGWVFTGIHKDNDLSDTHYWDAGWHLCNRTGEYAVVITIQ